MFIFEEKFAFSNIRLSENIKINCKFNFTIELYENKTKLSIANDLRAFGWIFNQKWKTNLESNFSSFQICIN